MKELITGLNSQATKLIAHNMNGNKTSMKISLEGTTKKKSTKMYDAFPSQNKYLDFSIDLSDVSNPQIITFFLILLIRT